MKAGTAKASAERAGGLGAARNRNDPHRVPVSSGARGLSGEEAELRHPGTSGSGERAVKAHTGALVVPAAPGQAAPASPELRAPGQQYPIRAAGDLTQNCSAARRNNLPGEGSQHPLLGLLAGARVIPTANTG